MRHIDKVAWLVLSAVIFCGLWALVTASSLNFVGCSPTEKVEDHFKEAIAVLTDIVKWGIGIAVSTAGLFGSQLLAVKTSPRYSNSGKLLLVSIVVAMCIAAYFGLRWRSRVAETWFLRCPDLIATDYIQALYHLHTYFLAGGLGILALMAILMAIPASSDP